MAVEATKIRGIINHRNNVHGNYKSWKGSNLDEGFHQRDKDPIGGIPALLQQSKFHPPCEECILPLEDQAHSKEISLAPEED